jgi:hypothetical protein
MRIVKKLLNQRFSLKIRMFVICFTSKKVHKKTPLPSDEATEKVRFLKKAVESSFK